MTPTFTVFQALDLAAQATQAQEFKDWWWKVQLGRCYYRLGLFRDAEKQFKVRISIKSTCKWAEILRYSKYL